MSGDHGFYARDFQTFTLFRASVDVRGLPMDDWAPHLVAFAFELTAFEAWLRRRWSVLDWTYSGPPQNPEPHHGFVLDDGRRKPADIAEAIAGFVSEDATTISLGCQSVFLHDFLTGLLQEFPGNAPVYVSVGYDLHIMRFGPESDRFDFLDEIHAHDEVVAKRSWVLPGGRI